MRSFRALGSVGLVVGALAGVNGSAHATAIRNVPVAVEIAISPAHPHAGQTVTFRINTSSRDAGATVGWWDVGDGSGRRSVAHATVACPPGPGRAPAARPSSSTSVTHAIYRRAGYYTFTAFGVHDRSCAPAFDRGTGLGHVSFGVEGPDAASNGPLSPLPNVGVFATRTGVSATWIWAADPDGVIRRVVLAQDGHARTYTIRHECSDPQVRWQESHWYRRISRPPLLAGRHPPRHGLVNRLRRHRATGHDHDPADPRPN
ncbi:MAG TPA: PKD domain-containing protein [Mycobacteriales bacterium]|nr:PKD domain-containing protein [Mycobacteriales bacterium]